MARWLQNKQLGRDKSMGKNFKINTPFLLALGLILGVVTFAFDIGFSLGVASWVGYLAMILIGLWLPYLWYPFIAAGGCSLLALYGFFFARIDVPLWVAVLNEALALFSFWLMAFLVFVRRKEANALFESQRTLANLMGNLPGMAYRCRNDKHRTMELVSQGCYALTGYYPNELTGEDKLSYDQLIFPDDRELIWMEIHSALKQNRSYRLIYRISTANGKIKWLWEQGCPVRNEEGKILFFEGFVTDITEREKAEKKLQETNYRLEKAMDELKSAHQDLVKQERLNALGEMASGIAHDFNNSLTAIIGFSELMLEFPKNLKDFEKAKNFVNSIRSVAEDAGTIVERLKEFYQLKGENAEFKPVFLDMVMEQALALSESKWKTDLKERGINIDIVKDLQKVPAVNANEAELREVLSHVIYNAVEAMPKGGILSLTTREEKGNAVAEVSDTGMGMSEKTLKKCFDPFFSTKGEKGAGLGLSLSSVIVKRFNGELKVKSKEGEGTTMKIFFPVEGAVFEEKEPEATDMIEGPLRVLLVEDDPAVMEVITGYLKNDGHFVIGVSDSQTALKEVKKNKFDLIISDGVMSRMRFDTFLPSIKKKHPNLPVILITGFRDASKESPERPNGVDLVVFKPITHKMLKKSVNKVIASSGRKAA